MQNLTDEQLVALFKKGNQEALEVLIQRYIAPLYNFVFQYMHGIQETEDVTQEVFVKIWKHISAFKSTYKFKTWAYTIAKNTALDALKKKGLVPFSELDAQDENQPLFAETLVSKDPLPEEILYKLDDIHFVNRAIEDLPEKYQKVLAMRYRQDLTFREIAKTWKQSIDTVKTQHRRAIVYLKKALLDK